MARILRVAAIIVPGIRLRLVARIVAAISRALREDTSENVHFHAGSNGPYVCENPGCTSPGLDPQAV